MLGTKLLVVLASFSLATPPATADPFAEDRSVPSPEGPEWEAPPEPPPPPPPAPPRPETVLDDETARPEIEELDDENPHKPVIVAGVIVGALGVASAILATYVSGEKKKTESLLKTTEQSNAALVAAGLPPSGTSDLEDKIDRTRTGTIGLGVGAATLLLTGGILLLVGVTRTRARNQNKLVTWAPRGTGIAVSF